MRATTHFARTTRGGKAFSVKHNDRNYPAELTPDNVVAEKSKENVYHICYLPGEPAEAIQTFEQHEKWVYANYLGEFFKKQNEKHTKARQKNRIKTSDEFRKMSRYCPEEVLWYVGQRGNSATAEQLETMARNQIEWEETTFPGLKYLDWAVHVDEMGAPHVQARRIWTYQSDGIVAVGQNKSLEQMGVALPNPDEKITQENNRKITYTAESRAYWIQQAENLGYEIEKKPRKTGGKTLQEWQAEQDFGKKIKKFNAHVKTTQAEIEEFRLLQAEEKKLTAEAEELISRGEYHKKSPQDVLEALIAVTKSWLRLKVQQRTKKSQNQGQER